MGIPVQTLYHERQFSNKEEKNIRKNKYQHNESWSYRFYYCAENSHRKLFRKPYLFTAQEKKREVASTHSRVCEYV